jgi:TRAP-type C4-dicarboxylate transport system substrate-binding protein
MESLGLSPVVLPVTDVLTGLQTGLLDVVAASPVTALVLQWHTKVKYRTDLPVSYSMGVFAIEARTFGRLSADDQRIVRDVMGDVMLGLDRASRDDNRQAEQVLEQNRVASVAVNSSDIESWRQTIAGIYPELRRRPDIDAALLDELLAVLAEYRSRAPGAASGE